MSGSTEIFEERARYLVNIDEMMFEIIKLTRPRQIFGSGILTNASQELPVDEITGV